MTVSASQSLSRAVLGVAETGAKGATPRRGARVWRNRVTGIARAYVASGRRLAVRRVATVALIVRGQSGGNGERNAAIDGRRMTGHATLRGACLPAHVLRVIKLHIKAILESLRKSFDGSRWPIDIRVANHAHGNLRRDELRKMATGTGFVAGKRRP